MAIRVDYIDLDFLQTDSTPPMLPSTAASAALQRMAATAVGTLTGFDLVADGETFDIDDGGGGGAVTFEFDDDGSVGVGNIPIPIGKRLKDLMLKGALHAPGVVGTSAGQGENLFKLIQITASLINSNVPSKNFSATLTEDRAGLILRNVNSGVAGNVPIVETSALTASGMDGALATLAAVDIIDIDELSSESHKMRVIWDDGT